MATSWLKVWLWPMTQAETVEQVAAILDICALAHDNYWRPFHCADRFLGERWLKKFGFSEYRTRTLFKWLVKVRLVEVLHDGKSPPGRRVRRTMGRLVRVYRPPQPPSARGSAQGVHPGVHSAGPLPRLGGASHPAAPATGKRAIRRANSQRKTEELETIDPDFRTGTSIDSTRASGGPIVELEDLDIPVNVVERLGRAGVRTTADLVSAYRDKAIPRGVTRRQREAIEVALRRADLLR